jgi:hypothetical protein
LDSSKASSLTDTRRNAEQDHSDRSFWQWLIPNRVIDHDSYAAQLRAMSDFSTAIALDPVKQFSVFAENRVGRLYDLAAVFKAHNVHMVALTVLDTTDSSILRFLVDDPDQARELMINNDFPFTEVSVLATEIEGEHRIKDVLGALLEAEINIHYVYSFLVRPSEKNGLVINVEDADVAAEALNCSGFRILTQADISR